MVLNDDETFTDLSGCKLIRLADEFADDDLDTYHFEEAIRAILSNDFGYLEDSWAEEGRVLPDKIGEVVAVFD